MSLNLFGNSPASKSLKRRSRQPSTLGYELQFFEKSRSFKVWDLSNHGLHEGTLILYEYIALRLL
ncbi:hypothetical protein Plhal304r1_c015g0055691 [Plasmopara halstedii]